MVDAPVKKSSRHQARFQVVLRAAVPVGVAALFAVNPIVFPAYANDYETCATDLLKAGIDAEAATTACARALHPDEVSACVTGVQGVTSLAGLDILSACSRDRRPKEVASCVGMIHGDLTVDDSASVLDHCHRSILPIRFSECVVGLSASTPLALSEALSTCISAGYRPEDIAPTFIPSD